MSTATLYELRGAAAWITLNRPDSRNALSDEIVDGLLNDLRRALEDDGARVIVVTGSGPVFCAGADLKGGGVRAGEGENPFVSVLKTIWGSPKPVIARVNGHAFGGGVGLAAACDLSVAVDAAQFTFSEVRVGVIPAMISVVVLPKLGVQNAMWLFLTGERFGAARAAALGLIHRAVPAEQLDAAVDEIAGMIRLGGPNAIREAKQLVRKVPEMSLDEAFDYTGRKIAELFASEEAAEGMRAFAEKRKPRWAE
jgi:methylglutaconyl-CoA hydratase